MMVERNKTLTLKHTNTASERAKLLIEIRKATELSNLDLLNKVCAERTLEEERRL